MVRRAGWLSCVLWLSRGRAAVCDLSVGLDCDSYEGEHAWGPGVGPDEVG